MGSLSLFSATAAFNAPAFHAPVASRAAAAAMAAPDINKMIGKYSVKGTVYDPLGLSTKYDLNWMREAELKHGRLCMLAVVGWLTVDAGITFPGPAFEGIKSIAAHDAAVKSGWMWALLASVSALEAIHMSVVVPKLDGDWGDWEPGNYGVDPFKMANENRKIAELKNGRLAMLGFSGLVTQAALGYPDWPQ